MEILFALLGMFSLPLVVFLVILLLISIRQVNQYERGVKFRFGRYVGTVNPGWRIIVPIIESMQKVDIRVKAADIPDQEGITKDNISVRINAVIYYRISDAAKAIIGVENFRYAIMQLASTTMRNVVGEFDLDGLLSGREVASTRIRELIGQLTEPWGILVENVELKDITLPEEMKRTIAKQAEAERERRAVIINSEGEVIASQNLAKAAATLAAAPGALHLRTLNTINDVSSDESNTVIFAIPIEVLRAFDRGEKK